MINKEGKRGENMSKCEECDADISIPKDAMEGEIVTCPECGASFELAKGSSGFQLKPAQSVGEDWGQ
jgi:alpha-aminoadipate/glutamate carrier protein LysW